MEAVDDVVAIQEHALERDQDQPAPCTGTDDHMDAHDPQPASAQPVTHATDEPVSESIDLSHAYAHFDLNMARCRCYTTCNFTGALELAVNFAHMRNIERVSYVRAMLFALTAPPDTEHELSEWRPADAQARKRLRRATEASTRCTTVYSIRGKRLCRFAFAAIVQLSPIVVNRHGVEVSTTSPSVYSTNAGSNRIGLLSVQSWTVTLFLRRYGSLHSLSCPTGRGSTDESPISWLASDTTRTNVYEAYKMDWDTIAASVIENGRGNAQMPEAPLSKDQFCRVWSAKVPTLRIHKLGSDFCDTCTKLINTYNNMTDPTTRAAIWQARVQHRGEALSEFRLYRQLQTDLKGIIGGPLHLTFDFAEKVLLPCLVRQPGQLHFVTGIKFDLFGVTSSTLNNTFVFGLPEGHWPGGKTANEVCSMLDYVIHAHGSGTVNAARGLHLHADNCAGQNKNRFVLFYLAWRCMKRFESNITLRFLVAGHTKNACDAAFGHVKRRLKHTNVLSPKDMMAVIEQSAFSNKVVPSKSVCWIDWKSLLSQFFTIPTKFKISEYHIFNFDPSSPAVVKVKRLSTSSTWESYSILKKGLSIAEVLGSVDLSISSGNAALGTTALLDVPSQNEGNRYAYLVKNVCERYYTQDGTFLDAYFGSGEYWQNSNAV